MLIQFTVENYLSFKDANTLSMVAAKSFKEHGATHLLSTDSNISLLKSAVIYGNNSSGKSNLIRAMRFMKSTVLTSFRDALQEERTFPLKKFALSTETEGNTSFFEIAFIQDGTKYRYGFEIDYDRVVAEWLYHTTSKEVYLFRRENAEIEVNKSSFKEGLGKSTDLKSNVLFLSLLATLGKPIASSIVNWFKNLNFVSGINDLPHQQYTIGRLKSDPSFHAWVLKFIKYLEIANLSTTERDVSATAFDEIRRTSKDEEVLNILESIQKLQARNPKQDGLLTYHRKYDANQTLVDTVPFSFETQESAGTQKLVYLLGPWYDSLMKSKVLIVDELDSRLHSQLTRHLIGYFHEQNDHNSQLICAVHDTALLNKEIFRRDQIWFVEKNQFGASELFSLADFKTSRVRNKSAFDKNYLEGKYGAVPYFLSSGAVDLN